MALQRDPKPDDPALFKRFLDLATEALAVGDQIGLDEAAKQLAKYRLHGPAAKRAKTPVAR